MITAIMVNDIYGWELSHYYEKVVVKQFSGLTTEDMMTTYIKPPLKYYHDHLIIHVGTNDLRSNQDRETI